jgi:DNA-binding PucR family transcriptional regulator
VARGLSVPALIGGDADVGLLVLPDPDAPGLSQELTHAVDSHAAALGPAVTATDAHRSLHWARLALGLVRRGGLPDERPTRVDRHLGELILLQDAGLAAELISRRLTPLLELPGAERDRLLETLEAWLAHQRHTPAIAEALHVHPQTVRYRLSRLRELFGPGLDSPDGRFELELALRARRALDNAAAAPDV